MVFTSRPRHRPPCSLHSPPLSTDLPPTGNPTTSPPNTGEDSCHRPDHPGLSHTCQILRGSPLPAEEKKAPPSAHLPGTHSITSKPPTSSSVPAYPDQPLFSTGCPAFMLFTDIPLPSRQIQTQTAAQGKLFLWIQSISVVQTLMN